MSINWRTVTVAAVVAAAAGTATSVVVQYKGNLAAVKAKATK